MIFLFLSNKNVFLNFIKFFFENLVEFFSVIKKKIVKEDLDDFDYFDENSNLFNSNINLINNDLMTNKSRLKAVRNSLSEFPSQRLKRRKVKLLIFFIFFCCNLTDLNTLDYERI